MKKQIHSISSKLQLALANRIVEIDLPIEALEDMPEYCQKAFFFNQWILCVEDLPCGGCGAHLIKPKPASK
jgi:hypothetical protein